LVLFSFALISPALFAEGDSNLPACCRRAGIHKCAMAAQRSGASGPSVNASRCASFPGARAVPAPARLAGLVRNSQAVQARTVTHRSVQPQANALYRISYSRAGQKRGPPAPLL
jgi:hypothetical protein